MNNLRERQILLLTEKTEEKKEGEKYLIFDVGEITAKKRTAKM